MAGSHDFHKHPIRPNPNRTKLKKRQRIFLEAYEKNDFDVTKAIEAAGIHRSTYGRWNNSDPCFMRHIGEIRQRLVEMAESVVIRELRKGNPDIAKFVLKTFTKGGVWLSSTDPQLQPQLSINFVNINTPEDVEKFNQLNTPPTYDQDTPDEDADYEELDSDDETPAP